MDLPAIDHFDVWLSAREPKQNRGRGSKKSALGFAALRRLIFELASDGKFDGHSDVTAEKIEPYIELIMGQAPPGKDCNKSGVGTIFVKTGQFDKTYPRVEEWTTNPLRMAQKGDVLICVVGATIGKLNLAIDSAIGRSVAALRPKKNLDTRYLFYSLHPFTLRLRSESKGSAQGVIGKKKLNAVKIRILPLNSQKRIVAKVDELMGLIDDLEAETEAARESHAELVDALLRTLVESEDADALAKNWKTLSEHFDTLFTTEQSVEKLKNTILKLAIRGKIVRQKANTQNARELLKNLRLEREKKEQSKEIKRSKLQTLEGPFPHEIPNSWAWVTFPEIGVFERGKSKHRPRNDKKLFNPGAYPLVQTGEIARANRLVTEVHSYYSEFGLAQSRLWPRGTLCITIAANIADTAILNFDACFPDSVVGFIPFEPISDVNYFLYFVKTAKQELLDYAPSTAQKNINLGILEKVAIPLPPLEEQERIVQKVGEMMTFCDNLVKNIRKSETLKVELAESVVYHASVN